MDIVNKIFGGYMSKLHQKKFYSSPEVDKAVERYAKKTGYGFSAALRHIVMSWALVTIPKLGSEAYNEYVRNFPISDPRD